MNDLQVTHSFFFSFCCLDRGWMLQLFRVSTSAVLIALMQSQMAEVVLNFFSSIQSDIAALKFFEAVEHAVMVALSSWERRTGHLLSTSASQVSRVLRAVTNSCSALPASTAFPSHLGLALSSSAERRAEYGEAKLVFFSLLEVRSLSKFTILLYCFETASALPSNNLE